MDKNNTKHIEVQEMIQSFDPDVLMFVEFGDNHYLPLKSFLQEHYPYTNNVSRSKSFLGSMVFSKYPIDNKADEFPQLAWRYGYFTISYQDADIYVYLVHTSSPNRYNHFTMRNEQLITFTEDFLLHDTYRSS